VFSSITNSRISVPKNKTKKLLGLSWPLGVLFNRIAVSENKKKLVAVVWGMHAIEV
jgi:hypothetical protein